MKGTDVRILGSSTFFYNELCCRFLVAQLAGYALRLLHLLSKQELGGSDSHIPL